MLPGQHHHHDQSRVGDDEGPAGVDLLSVGQDPDDQGGEEYDSEGPLG